MLGPTSHLVSASGWKLVQIPYPMFILIFLELPWVANFQTVNCSSLLPSRALPKVGSLEGDISPPPRSDPDEAPALRSYSMILGLSMNTS